MTKRVWGVTKQLQGVVGCVLWWCHVPVCVCGVGVELPYCVHVCVCTRLHDVGAYLLVDEECSLIQQVHTISNVEESIYMESSVQPYGPQAR